MLGHHGLAAALHWHAETSLQRTGSGCRGAPTTRRSGRAHVEIALFRIAQEALNNVAKHADAKRAVIAFEHVNGECVMSVEDDGVGSTPLPTTRTSRSPGYGW